MTKSEHLANCAGFWDKCLDCGGDNHPYMINFALWNKLVAKKDRTKVICIPCIEKRLGRDLKFFDFIKAPINSSYLGFNAKTYCNLPKRG